MTRVVYKNLLPRPGETLVLPMSRVSDALPIVHIANQHRVPTFWYETIKDGNLNSTLIIYCVGTGHDIPEETEYVGSLMDDPFVWHYYAGWR